MPKFRSKYESTLDIVVPVFNGGAYLRDALTSLENLIRQPEQIILIDNCSTDNSSEIMKEWARNRKGVVFVQNNQLLSFADNWNYGLRLAKSEYVHFLAHDDFINPNFVENFKKISNKYSKPDAFIFRVYVAGEHGKNQAVKLSIPIDYILNSKLYLKRSIIRNPFNLAGAVFRREKMLEIGFMDAKYSIWSDWVLWQKILMSGTIVRSLRVASTYRIHSDVEKKTNRKDLVDKDLATLILHQLPIIFKHIEMEPENEVKLKLALELNVRSQSQI